MAFLSSLNIPGSALTAQKQRMEVIAQNLANAGTTSADKTYRKKTVELSERRNYSGFDSALSKAVNEIHSFEGVQIASIKEEESFILEYDPDNPSADENGYVKKPDIDTTGEMVDMMYASRAFEANVTALNAVKQMAAKALEIGK
ncbi:MAG: flagellar basal body rod protein FlgC [Clostridia bacterium]|nr:flagellar basal body rod protein FlgC [Clostridia bacterium]